MPTSIRTDSDLQPGDIYEDGFFHPCLCLGIVDGQAWGISLVDRSHPRCIDLRVSGIAKLSLEEAWIWRTSGPRDNVVDPKNRWW
jgi:hypothetical protein